MTPTCSAGCGRPAAWRARELGLTSWKDLCTACLSVLIGQVELAEIVRLPIVPTRQRPP